MEMHPLVVKIGLDGQPMIVFHPGSQAGEADALSQALGVVQTEKRAAHVLPKNLLLRKGFFALRRLFGDSGPVSDWTRSWKVQWEVILVDGASLGTFSSHAKGVAAEVEHILRTEG